MPSSSVANSSRTTEKEAKSSSSTDLQISKLRFDHIDHTSHLRSAFGHGSFRSGQLPVINSVLDSQDCMAVFPTGAGKVRILKLNPNLNLRESSSWGCSAAWASECLSWQSPSHFFNPSHSVFAIPIPCYSSARSNYRGITIDCSDGRSSAAIAAVFIVFIVFTVVLFYLFIFTQAARHRSSIDSQRFGCCHTKRSVHQIDGGIEESMSFSWILLKSDLSNLSSKFHTNHQPPTQGNQTTLRLLYLTPEMLSNTEFQVGDVFGCSICVITFFSVSS
jgi:hypothetical protein